MTTDELNKVALEAMKATLSGSASLYWLENPVSLANSCFAVANAFKLESDRNTASQDKEYKDTLAKYTQEYLPDHPKNWRNT
jgi:hypothetical protein